MSSNQRSTLESNPPKHQLTHHPNSDQGNRRNDQKQQKQQVESRVHSCRNTKHFADFLWLHARSRQPPLDVFCWIYWLCLCDCILWKWIVHILLCVFLFSFSNNIFLLIKKKKGKINATIFAVHQAALKECQCLANLAFKIFMSIFWICMTVVLPRTLCSVILSFCCIKKKRDPFPVFHACILILISNFL